MVGYPGLSVTIVSMDIKTIVLFRIVFLTNKGALALLMSVRANLMDFNDLKIDNTEEQFTPRKSRIPLLEVLMFS